MRGIPIARASNESGADAAIKLFSAGATLVQACYYAFENYGEYENVQKLKASGFPGVLLVNKDTPSDVMRWMRKTANRFHEGQAWSIVESIEDTVQANPSRTLNVP